MLCRQLGRDYDLQHLQASGKGRTSDVSSDMEAIG